MSRHRRDQHRPTRTRFVCFTAGLLLLLQVVGWWGLPDVSAQSAGEVLDLAEFKQWIQEIVPSARPLRPPQMARLRSITALRLDDGGLVTLETFLPATASDAVINDRMVFAQTHFNFASSDDAAQRLQRLDAILAQREFDSLRTGPSLWQRFLDWLRGWLPQSEATSQGAQRPERVTEPGWWIVAGVILVPLLLVFSYWLRALLRGVVNGAEAPPTAAEADLPVSATAAQQQAVRLAHIGNYRQAVRQLYLSALLHLSEQGLLHYDRSLTNREYLAQVANQAPIERHLRPVVQTFDDVWYGVHEPDRTTFDDYQEAIARLREVRP